MPAMMVSPQRKQGAAPIWAFAAETKMAPSGQDAARLLDAAYEALIRLIGPIGD
jgi:hypothetical protein